MDGNKSRRYTTRQKKPMIEEELEEENEKTSKNQNTSNRSGKRGNKNEKGANKASKGKNKGKNVGNKEERVNNKNEPAENEIGSNKKSETQEITEESDLAQVQENIEIHDDSSSGSSFECENKAEKKLGPNLKEKNWEINKSERQEIKKISIGKEQINMGKVKENIEVRDDSSSMSSFECENVPKEQSDPNNVNEKNWGNNKNEIQEITEVNGQEGIDSIEIETKIEVKDDSSSMTSFEGESIPKNKLDPYNVKEKIIIVYDSAMDEVATEFKYKNKNIPIDAMLKKSIHCFLQMKHLINESHEYALVVLEKNDFAWAVDFTNDINKIVVELNNVEACEPEDIIVLDRLFEIIEEKIQIKTDISFNLPPEYIVRVIFTYGRSYTLPQLNDVPNILTSPVFFFDLLYTHEIPSSTNHSQKIFKNFQSLDKKGFSYFFSVVRDPMDLKVSMAKLLGHPLQRPRQQVANYSLII